MIPRAIIGQLNTDVVPGQLLCRKKLFDVQVLRVPNSTALINPANPPVTRPAELWSSSTNGSFGLSEKGPPSRIDEALSTMVG